MEQSGAEVSGRYRAASGEEPPVRLDAAIVDAARREVEQQRRQKRRGWQVPASIAAMLVIGFSLMLTVRDNEPPLSSLHQPAAGEAKPAKPAAPQPAMTAQPKVRANVYREARPSRERTARPERDSGARDESARAQGFADRGTPVPSAPVAPQPVKPPEQERPGTAESGISHSEAKVLADAAPRARNDVQALGKQGPAGEPLQPRDWLGKIDDLLRDGRETEARRQLQDFRQQYPRYPLDARLRALLGSDQR
jgi:hypothetical protein